MYKILLISLLLVGCTTLHKEYKIVSANPVVPSSVSISPLYAQRNMTVHTIDELLSNLNGGLVTFKWKLDIFK